MKNNSHINIKQELLAHCKLFVLKQRKTISDVMSSSKKALDSESKSSAGDKHETGRAMLQLEMEKTGQQLAGIVQMEETLQRIRTDQSVRTGCLGALIHTNKGNYFLAISVGEVLIESIRYYIISTKSPIGKQLLGKKPGDTIPFNGATIGVIR